MGALASVIRVALLLWMPSWVCRAEEGALRQAIEGHFNAASGAVNGQHSADTQRVKNRGELPDQAAAEHIIHATQSAPLGMRLPRVMW